MNHNLSTRYSSFCSVILLIIILLREPTPDMRCSLVRRMDLLLGNLYSRCDVMIPCDQILAVWPQGRRHPRLIVIVKIMIFFCTFWFLSLRMTWHLYLHSYCYGLCHSRRPGCLYQIGPRGETFDPKCYSVNISQIQYVILCPGRKLETPWI